MYCCRLRSESPRFPDLADGRAGGVSGSPVAVCDGGGGVGAGGAGDGGAVISGPAIRSSGGLTRRSGLSPRIIGAVFSGTFGRSMVVARRSASEDGASTFGGAILSSAGRMSTYV